MVLRGSDGSIYFIRDELMEACRVTEKDMADAMNQLLEGQGDVAGFATSSAPVDNAVRISGGAGRPNQDLENLTTGATRRSTIMCPW
jgi:hypothetical protein